MPGIRSLFSRGTQYAMQAQTASPAASQTKTRFWGNLFNKIRGVSNTATELKTQPQPGGPHSQLPRAQSFQNTFRSSKDLHSAINALYLRKQLSVPATQNAEVEKRLQAMINKPDHYAKSTQPANQEKDNVSLSSDGIDVSLFAQPVVQQVDNTNRNISGDFADDGADNASIASDTSDVSIPEQPGVNETSNEAIAVDESDVSQPLQPTVDEAARQIIASEETNNTAVVEQSTSEALEPEIKTKKGILIGSNKEAASSVEKKVRFADQPTVIEFALEPEYETQSVSALVSRFSAPASESESES